MNLLQFLLNILWIAVGGIWMSVAWVIAGLIIGADDHRSLDARGLPHRSLHTAALRQPRHIAGGVHRAPKMSAPGRWALSATSCGWSSRAGGWRWGTS